MITKAKKNAISKSIILFILLIIAFIICMKSPLNPFTENAVTGTDSSVFKYIGWRMTNGEVPYKDMFDHKGILLYFINYLGTLISFHRGVWIIEYFFMFISLVLAFKIFRKFCSSKSSLIAILLTFAPLYNYFEGGNLTEEYALPFIILGLYIFIDFFTNTDKYLSKNINKKNLIDFNGSFFNFKVFICGISFACTFFLRQNMISLWIVFCIAILIFCLYKKLYKEILKFIVSFLLGLLLITVPIMIYLCANGAFNDFIEDFFTFNFMYSTDEERATLPNKITSFFYFFNTNWTILAFLLILIKIKYNYDKKKIKIFDVAYVVYMLLNLGLLCISGMTFGHYGMLIIPMLIYPYSILFKHLELKEMKKMKFYVIGYFLLIMIFPTWNNFLKDTLININKTEEMQIASDYSKDKLIEYIKSKTNEGDEIAVFGNSNAIYNFTKTKSASKYSYTTPIIKVDKDIEEEYFKDLEEKLPKLIVWGSDKQVYERQYIRMQQFLESNDYYMCSEVNNFEVYCIEKIK